MWKYRDSVLFGTSLLFAAVTVVTREMVPLLATALFLSGHYLDRFFGVDKVDSKALGRVAVMEADFKALKDEISTIKLAAGIRGRS